MVLLAGRETLSGDSLFAPIPAPPALETAKNLEYKERYAHQRSRVVR
jgi:hypothetical protein